MRRAQSMRGTTDD
uniref:Uncharacterized protein n=1 Tax=Arundo donax TaxID=35708 RepID=A0A0A9AFS7_ARUDO